MTSEARRTAQMLGSIFAVPCAFLGVLGWIYLVAGLYNSGFPDSTESVGLPFFLLGVVGWLLWIVAVLVIAAAFGFRTKIAKVGYAITGLMLIIAIATGVTGG